MDRQITIQGLEFDRGQNEGGLYYEYGDPNTGIKWMVLRPACPEYCTPYWTGIVERGTSLRTLTSCTELGGGRAVDQTAVSMCQEMVVTPGNICRETGCLNRQLVKSALLLPRAIQMSYMH